MYNADEPARLHAGSRPTFFRRGAPVNDSILELRQISDTLQATIERMDDPSILSVLSAMEDAATQIEKASSGSWLGYQAYVYYNEFKSPPPGHHFSKESGLDQSYPSRTRGDWKEYDFDVVKDRIDKMAGSPSLEKAAETSATCRTAFEHAQAQVVSILEVECSNRNDNFLRKLLDDVGKIQLTTTGAYLNSVHGAGQIITYDNLALSQGTWVPPHQVVLAKLAVLRSPRVVAPEF
jgi:hypothetical protein